MLLFLFTVEQGFNFLLNFQAERESWEKKQESAAVYAVMGRRPSMEDRFVLEQINGTDVNFFAIFDGHGGSMAAEFAKEILVQNLQNKIIEISNIMHGKATQGPLPEPKVEESCDTPTDKDSNNKNENKEVPPSPSNAATQRRKSFKKSLSKEDYTDLAGSSNKDIPNQVSDPEILSKLNSKPITRENIFSSNKSFKAPPKPKQYEAKCYIDNGKINFGKLLTDEVIAADYALVEKAKKSTNIAGTTALIAILHKNKLTVANVGDSRGVMADHKGAAIPLSFDHKPQQVRFLYEVIKVALL